MIKKIKDYISKIPKATIIASVVGAVLFVVILLCLWLTFGKKMTAFISDPVIFKAWLGQYDGFSQVVFVLIRSLQTVVKFFPAEPLEIGSGYAFGTFGGLLWCLLGSFLGSLVIVLLTKKFGVKFVNKFIPTEDINSLALLKNKKRLMMFIFIFYLIPGTPKDIMTYVAGLTKINMTKFLLITTIARIPSIITSTFCGSAFGEGNKMLALAVFIATAVFSVICAYVYKNKSSAQTEQK